MQMGVSPLMRQRMSVRLAGVISGGSTRKRTRVHVVHLGGLQSWRGTNPTPYGTTSANTFCRGPVARGWYISDTCCTRR